MTIFTDIVQGSADWLALRKGRPTASRFSDIITASKGELSKASHAYIRELIGECFVPDFEYWNGNADTERGKILEDEARQAFANTIKFSVEQVGFCLSSDGVSGCSPDGLVRGKDGEYAFGVEIKCPTPKVHIGYIIDQELPDAYKQQVHGSMAVTGLDEWHFWSYCRGLKPFHIIVSRDEYTDKLEDALALFVADYKQTMQAITPLIKLPKSDT